MISGFCALFKKILAHLKVMKIVFYIKLQILSLNRYWATHIFKFSCVSFGELYFLRTNQFSNLEFKVNYQKVFFII